MQYSQAMVNLVLQYGPKTANQVIPISMGLTKVAPQEEGPSTIAKKDKPKRKKRTLTGEDDELEEAANQAHAEEKSIMSSTTPLLPRFSSNTNEKSQWHSIIGDFFELRKMHDKELLMVLKLQRFSRSLKLQRLKKRFLM
jgi:hypothetical protein